MNTRGLRSLYSIFVLVLFLPGLGWAQTTTTTVKRGGTGKIKKVYVNLSGDPKLSQRLWTVLGFELDDIGVLLTNTEDDADAMISGEVKLASEQTLIGVGVVHMQTRTNKGEDKLEDCASLSSDENGELFDRAGFASELRRKYPDAKTVSMDASSDLHESERLGDEIQPLLKESDFTLIQSGPADIVLRIVLERKKVPIDVKNAKMRIQVLTRGHSAASSSNSSFVLSAKLAGQPPAACPDRFDNLEWLSGTSSLYAEARNIAKTIEVQNSKANSAKPSPDLKLIAPPPVPK